VKAGWEVRPLGEVCEVLDRLRKPITKKNRSAGPYPYYGATGILDHVDGYLFDEPLVLLGEDGAKWEAGANSAFPIEGKVWVNNHAHVLRPIREEILDDWLIYFLNGSDLLPFISGMTVPKLNQGRMREIPVPLPPLEEQQRIVAVLDEAFDGLARARAHAEANLQNARELFSNVLDEALQSVRPDWRTLIVADTLTRIKVPAKIQRKAYLSEGDFPIVSQEAGLINGYWNDESDVIYLKKPVIVFGDHTRTLKYVDFDFVVGADGTQIMAPIECLDPYFYYYALKTIDLEGKGYARHFSHLKKCEIHFPESVEAQQSIATQLNDLSESTRDLERQYARTLTDIDDLRQSLLQKAFAGELT